jgi:hypothetical protein
MPMTHITSEGDCISSIAYQFGFFPDTVWSHPLNTALKHSRKDMNVLLPGDEVRIPDLRIRTETRPSDCRHRFRRHGVPERLKIQLLLQGEPRSNQAFELQIDSTKLSGKTDSQGCLEVPIRPNSLQATLMLSETGESFQLNLGCLHPIETVGGVQGRLRNLGFYHGQIDDQLTDQTIEAIMAFQIHHELDPTGQFDDQLKLSIQKAYGG